MAGKVVVQKTVAMPRRERAGKLRRIALGTGADPLTPPIVNTRPADIAGLIATIGAESRRRGALATVPPLDTEVELLDAALIDEVLRRERRVVEVAVSAIHAAGRVVARWAAKRVHRGLALAHQRRGGHRRVRRREGGVPGAFHDRRAGVECIVPHGAADPLGLAVAPQAARRKAARQHAAFATLRMPARECRAQEFDEAGVVHAMQSGFREFTRRRLFEPAGPQCRQDVVDTRGRFERRHELAAIKLLATVVAGMTGYRVEALPMTPEKMAKEIAAETKQLIAKIDLETAELNAQKTVTLGRATAEAKKLAAEATSDKFRLAAKAFGIDKRSNQYDQGQHRNDP